MPIKSVVEPNVARQHTPEEGHAVSRPYEVLVRLDRKYVGRHGKNKRTNFHGVLKSRAAKMCQNSLPEPRMHRGKLRNVGDVLLGRPSRALYREVVAGGSMGDLVDHETPVQVPIYW